MERALFAWLRQDHDFQSLYCCPASPAARREAGRGLCSFSHASTAKGGRQKADNQGRSCPPSPLRVSTDSKEQSVFLSGLQLLTLPLSCPASLRFSTTIRVRLTPTRSSSTLPISRTRKRTRMRCLSLEMTAASYPSRPSLSR